MINKSQKKLDLAKPIKVVSVETKTPEVPGKEVSASFALCPVCGHKISIFYFTKITDSHGKVLHTRCPNCGFFDSPE